MKFLKTGNRVSPGICGLQPVALAVVATLMFAGAALASGQTLKTLVNFDGTNGAHPEYGNLASDANGDLFGTTLVGGAWNAGAVFEIVKTSSGYAAAPTVLYSFTGGNDGDGANAGLIADANDDLFGTTIDGGTGGYGTVFEIAKDATTATGYAAAPTVLVNFDVSNGGNPNAGLIADANGDLFGTTSLGGGITYGGTVFEIAKDTSTATGYASTPITLVSFDVSSGEAPFAGLIADANGDLFGTTTWDPTYSSGTVFEIAKDATTATGYASTPTTLVVFNNTDGALPYASLIADANGDLFGTTYAGGAYYCVLGGCGTVFEIAKDTSTATGYASAPTTLVNFNNTDGANPYASLIADARGNLFGTTKYGGTAYSGTVFEIAKDTTTATGYASTPTNLVNFNASTGGVVPYAGLIADANGDLFGTTAGGGTYEGPGGGYGTVFEVTGSGFVPPMRFAGTPGTANCKGVSISTLAKTYGGVAHAAAALKYASASEMQNAVAQYCGN